MNISSSYPTQDAHGLICFPIFPFGSRASDYGLVKFDHTGRVLQFLEKPKDADLNFMVSNSLWNPILLFPFFLEMNPSFSSFPGSSVLGLFRNDYLFCCRI